MKSFRFRKAFAVAFCAFLAWRAFASVVLLAREMRSYDAGSLMDALSISQEERIRRTLQDDYEIFAALRALAPDSGLVLFVTGSSLPTVRRALRIGQLLYPPRFEVVALLSPLLAKKTSESPVLAVDMSREAVPAPDAWGLVEDAGTFRIWRYRRQKGAGR